MKLPVLLGVLALIATPAIAIAADAPVRIDLDKPAEAPKAPKKDDSKKVEPKKEDAPGKIEGIEIKRGTGFMGIAVANGNFKLTFYDAKKKPVTVPPEVARAVLRWMPSYAQKDEHAVLNPAEDGKSLTSTKVVRPPLVFRLFITLQTAGSGEDNPSESYSIDFRGY